MVVFAFNRPDKLSRVLRALPQQQVERLIFFIDGPRNEAEAVLVQRSRKLAQGIRWAKTELHIWEENHGLKGLADNISLVLEIYPAAVFIEDDCLPMPGFFSFIKQALDHYQPDGRVFSIAGYQPITLKQFRNYPFSLVSSPRFNCWGWATWKDRWEKVKPHLSIYSELFDHLAKVPDIVGSDLPLSAVLMASGEAVESWDIKVALATLWLRMVHLTPTQGLIQNIGLGWEGTHGGFSKAFTAGVFHNQNVRKDWPSVPVWLTDSHPDPAYTHALKENVWRMQRYSPRRMLCAIRCWRRRLCRRPRSWHGSG